MDVRAFGSWTSAPTCLFFLNFEGLSKVFAPGHPPGYPRGRPPDVQPQNLPFGLLFSFLTLLARAARNAIHVNRFAVEAPIFIAHQADSPESLEFPIRANHATKVPDNRDTRSSASSKANVEESRRVYRAIHG